MSNVPVRGMMQGRYTNLAQEVGTWLARASDDGLAAPIGESLLAAFPDNDRSEIDMALFELGYDGLVAVSSVAGPTLSGVQPTYRLFALADPAVTGHSPRRDAAMLARWILDDPSYASIAKLFTASGWTLRRFNPAMGLLLAVFAEGRYNKSEPSNFPVSSVSIGSAEQLKLRRFIKYNS